METIAQIKGGASEDIIGSLDKKLALAMSSKIHFSIYVRALEHHGLNLDDITSDFGNLGILVANELISAGVLFLENGVLRSDLAGKEFRPGMRLVKQHGHMHIDMFQEAAPGYRMENIHAGVNEDGLKEVYGTLDGAISKVFEIVKNPKFKGNIMYLTTILGGPMSNPRKEQDQ
jgi:hypothetical protein